MTRFKTTTSYKMSEHENNPFAVVDTVSEVESNTEAKSFDNVDAVAEYIFGKIVASQIPKTFADATKFMRIACKADNNQFPIKESRNDSVTTKKWSIRIGNISTTSIEKATGLPTVNFGKIMHVSEVNPEVNDYGKEHGYTENARMKYHRRDILNLAKKLDGVEKVSIDGITDQEDSELPAEEWKLIVWQMALHKMVHTQNAQQIPTAQ